MELLQLAQENKIPLKTIDKYFFQGCVVAAQIQANCMSMVYLFIHSLILRVYYNSYQSFLLPLLVSYTSI